MSATFLGSKCRERTPIPVGDASEMKICDDQGAAVSVTMSGNKAWARRSSCRTDVGKETEAS
eukprot:836291-Karenia_brevis.AAC.1